MRPGGQIEFQTIEVNPTSDGTTAFVRTVPCHRVGPGGAVLVQENFDFAAKQIEHGQTHPSGLRQLVADGSAGVEWIGVFVFSWE